MINSVMHLLSKDLLFVRCTCQHVCHLCFVVSIWKKEDVKFSSGQTTVCFTANLLTKSSKTGGNTSGTLCRMHMLTRKQISSQVLLFSAQGGRYSLVCENQQQCKQGYSYSTTIFNLFQMISFTVFV